MKPWDTGNQDRAQPSYCLSYKDTDITIRGRRSEAWTTETRPVNYGRRQPIRQ